MYGWGLNSFKYDGPMFRSGYSSIHLNIHQIHIDNYFGLCIQWAGNGIWTCVDQGLTVASVLEACRDLGNQPSLNLVALVWSGLVSCSIE